MYHRKTNNQVKDTGTLYIVVELVSSPRRGFSAGQAHGTTQCMPFLVIYTATTSSSYSRACRHYCWMQITVRSYITKCSPSPRSSIVALPASVSIQCQHARVDVRQQSFNTAFPLTVSQMARREALLNTLDYWPGWLETCNAWRRCAYSFATSRMTATDAYSLATSTPATRKLSQGLQARGNTGRHLCCVD